MSKKKSTLSKILLVLKAIANILSIAASIGSMLLKKKRKAPPCDQVSSLYVADDVATCPHVDVKLKVDSNGEVAVELATQESKESSTMLSQM